MIKQRFIKVCDVTRLFLLVNNDCYDREEWSFWRDVGFYWKSTVNSVISKSVLCLNLGKSTLTQKFDWKASVYFLLFFKIFMIRKKKKKRILGHRVRVLTKCKCTKHVTFPSSLKLDSFRWIVRKREALIVSIRYTISSGNSISSRILLERVFYEYLQCRNRKRKIR